MRMCRVVDDIGLCLLSAEADKGESRGCPGWFFELHEYSLGKVYKHGSAAGLR